jgi:hypothetical protein
MKFAPRDLLMTVIHPAGYIATEIFTKSVFLQNEINKPEPVTLLLNGHSSDTTILNITAELQSSWTDRSLTFYKHVPMKKIFLQEARMNFGYFDLVQIFSRALFWSVCREAEVRRAQIHRSPSHQSSQLPPALTESSASRSTETSRGEDLEPGPARSFITHGISHVHMSPNQVNKRERREYHLALSLVQIALWEKEEKENK